VGNNGVIASIDGFKVVSDDFVGSWRRDKDNYIRQMDPKHEGRYGYMKNVAVAVKGLLAEQNFKPEDFKRVAIYAPEPRSYQRLGGMLGFDRRQLQDSMFLSIASTGTPLAMMMLIGALEKGRGDQKVLMANYGDGADAIALTLTDSVKEMKGTRRGMNGNLKTMEKLPHYGYYLRYHQVIDRDRFTPKSSTMIYWRDQNIVLRLHGWKCNNCGTVQYPRQRECFECRTKDDFEEVRLPKEGKVFTFTLDLLVGNSYLETPVPRIVIEMENGARIFLDMTDSKPEEVEIDMPVEFTFRRLHEGAGFHNYYWKCRPIRGKTDEEKEE
jgi:uncharacterized OB-fold protein